MTFPRVTWSWVPRSATGSTPPGAPRHRCWPGNCAAPGCPPRPGRWSPWIAWPWVPPRGSGWRPAARWSLTWSPRRWPRPRGTGRSRCSVRAASPVLARWAAVAGPRRVLLAGPRSFCAGVERAIEIVEKILDQRGAPVYVRKQIVHNTHVVADLERRGAVFVDELSEVPDGACVVFSAHGVSPAVRAEAARRGLDAIDATCPLVAKVHAEARRFAADGYLVALIGH